MEEPYDRLWGMSKQGQKGRVSLDRALSKLGMSSRTEAKALIEGGRVRVHGSIEKNPARMVNPDTAHIEIDGKKAEKSGTRLIIFHKPKGVLTTKRDPEGRKTIYDVLPLELHGLHPVGRLDQHTSGLLLLTNNTRLSSDLTDPKNRILRIYLAGVQGEVTDSTLEKMTSGIRDGGELLKAERAQVLKRSGKESLIELGLTEGKYREVRRLCMALGHEVRSLKRIRFGEYVLGDLKPGDWVDAVLDQAD